MSGFRNHLIFYRPIDDGIEIVRVLHGARDWQNLLELE
jgi:toxin ParE1/3/4